MKKTLNLGCGERVYKEYPEGYTCINLDKRSDLVGVDVIGSVEDLNSFKANEFDYILASDIIEHFPISRTVLLLKEWARVLKHGGIIEIRTPNMEWVAEYYTRTRDAKFVSYHIFGAQDYEGNYHYVIFDPLWLTELCSEAGLMVINVERLSGSNFILRAYKK